MFPLGSRRERLAPSNCDIEEEDLRKLNPKAATQPKEVEPGTEDNGGTKTPPRDGPDRYHIEVLGKALDVLDVLRTSRTDLRLTEIAGKAKLGITTAFRLLRTLEGRGYVLRDKETKRFKHGLGYRIRAPRIGYAQLSSDQPFSVKVTRSLVEAAQQYGAELVVTDNRYSPEEAVKNAAWLISQKVDFVVEFQSHYRVGPVLANAFSNAGIPTLAIDIVMPNSIFFGANNYVAGIAGGEALGRFALQNWRGRVDCILLLELLQAGPVLHARVLGTLEGLRSVLPKLDERRVLHRDSKGTEVGGYLATRRVLKTLGRRDCLLIAAGNDNSARGAIRAVREASRTRLTAIMAQGWGPGDGVEEELRKPDSLLIGAVAYFPEKYGSGILPVVLQCLNGQPVPPAVYIEHKLVMKEEIPHIPSAGRLPTEPSSETAGRDRGYRI
jgi:ribose transport system substrate-binding protein